MTRYETSSHLSFFYKKEQDEVHHFVNTSWDKRLSYMGAETVKTDDEYSSFANDSFQHNEMF